MNVYTWCTPLLPQAIFRFTCILSGTLLASMIVSCQGKQTHKAPVATEQPSLQPDTVIGSYPITNELAGGAYRKRATAYFVIIHSDTSAFQPVFSESLEGNVVSVHLRTLNNRLSYRQIMEQLNVILPEAAKSYNLKQVRGLNLQRLVHTGDLAIAITRQYFDTFGEKKRIRTSDYDEISKFLLQTPLASDFNGVFNPYGISVSGVGVEKVFLTSPKELSYGYKLETDSTGIPVQILDCLTWVSFKKNDPS